MNIELANNAHIRKVRQNAYQSCLACGKRLEKGIMAISFTKQLISNGVNVWIHTWCAKKYFNQILNNLEGNKGTLTAYKV